MAFLILITQRRDERAEEKKTSGRGQWLMKRAMRMLTGMSKYSDLLLLSKPVYLFCDENNISKSQYLNIVHPSKK
ncbi:hypothetical protein L1987_19860 [Smallanthus sonchifolius]|uniref:Uncharacterized protein n=1 Tax=Smallanthus sonchifolius TaxID=185202 RepID=A0ACB9IPS1_9ASTR|nr:hypothetical protein L1987_19860 [Smallanthus sonchifolius]